MPFGYISIYTHKVFKWLFIDDFFFIVIYTYSFVYSFLKYIAIYIIIYIYCLQMILSYIYIFIHLFLDVHLNIYSYFCVQHVSLNKPWKTMQNQ